MIQDKPYCCSQLPNGMMWRSGVRGTRGAEHMENCNLIRRSIFSIKVDKQCSRSSEGCRISIPGNIQNVTVYRPEHCDLVGHALSSTLSMEAFRGPSQVCSSATKYMLCLCHSPNTSYRAADRLSYSYTCV